MFDMIPSDAQTSHEEMALMGLWLRTVRLKLHEQQPAPSCIYHYTNAAGFYGVIESHAIHATHVSFMNDAEEYGHALDLLLKALIESEKTGLSAPQQRIVGVMKKNLENATPSSYFPLFVACFSSLEDDLSQWRSYGGPSAGFNIGVDVSHMRSLMAEWSDNKDFVGHVVAAIYDDAEKAALVRSVADFALDRYPKAEAKFAPADKNDFALRWMTDFFTLSCMLAPLLKHEKFKAESEWRLVLTPLHTKHVHFKPKQGLLSPHVLVSLKGKPHNGFDHPFRRAIVGPTRYGELNHLSARSMLALKGHARVEVGVSSIPYRDVS